MPAYLKPKAAWAPEGERKGASGRCMFTRTSGQQSRVEPRLLFCTQRAAKAPFRPKRATDFREDHGHFLRLPLRNCRAGLSADDQAGRRLTRRELHDGAPQKLRRHRVALQMTRVARPPSDVRQRPGLTKSGLPSDVGCEAPQNRRE
jgi:hypothetical protein